MSSATLTIIIIVAVIAVAALAVAGLQIARRKRTEQLRKRFGPEYERAVHESDNQREAEAQLRERVKRQKKLDLRPLDQRERSDFESRWRDVQATFVDDPSRAVRDADHLVVEVMSARGYPVDDFDQRAEDLSVEHPKVTQSYRKARGIARSNKDGSADTEDLRNAVTSYRELVEALLHDDTGHDSDAGHDGTDRDRGTDRNRRTDQDRAAERASDTAAGDDTHGHGDDTAAARDGGHADRHGRATATDGDEHRSAEHRSAEHRSTEHRSADRHDDDHHDDDHSDDGSGRGGTVNGAAHSLTTPSPRES